MFPNLPEVWSAFCDPLGLAVEMAGGNMAKCNECGAVVGDDLKFCGFCGAALSVVGPEVAQQLKEQVDSIKSDTSGLAAASLSPTSDSLLNRNHFGPIAQTASGATFSARALGKDERGKEWFYPITESWYALGGDSAIARSSTGWVYCQLDPGGEQFEVGVDVVLDAVRAERVVRWFDGKVRCSECASTFHFSRSVWFTPELTLDTGRCPVCTARSRAESAASNPAYEELALALNLPKPGLFSSSSAKSQLRDQAISAFRGAEQWVTTPIAGWSDLFAWNKLLGGQFWAYRSIEEVPFAQWIRNRGRWR